MSELGKLLREAKRLGIEDQIADVIRPTIAAAKRATKACEEFLWDDPCDDGQVLMLPTMPSVMWQLGELIAITYDATKRGEHAHWEHHFKAERPVLAFSEESDSLYVVGGDYSVTERGIVG